MKITSKENKLNPYDLGGAIHIKFKSGEDVIPVFESAILEVEKIHDKYGDLKPSFSMDMYQNILSIHWKRLANADEKKMMKDMQASDREKSKKQYLRHIKSEAKRLKIL